MRSRRARRLLSLLLALFMLGTACPATGHELESALLTMTEVAPGRFFVRFHANSDALTEDFRSPAVFPAPCRLEGPYLDCGPSGLVGPIEFPWLEGTLTRVMVQIEWQHGPRLVRVVSPSSPALTAYGLPASAGWRALGPVVTDYSWLGVEHILSGFDHLLFVVALSFLVGSTAALVTTITAFTLAHSTSLAATVLGVVDLPAPPVEAAIAFSVLLVCAECLRAGDSFTRRAPWLVAFAFGLLHGLGFASALLSIGLPEEQLPMALLSFNVGVELGQLAIIALGLGLRWLARRQRAFASHGLGRAVVHVMGATAAFWWIERLPAVLGL